MDDKYTTATTGVAKISMRAHGNVSTQSNARARLMSGVDAVADAVKLTLGASGANAIIQSELAPGHLVTNDGVSIANAIALDDVVANMGANLIKEIASRADKDSGDGTTTATVLAQAILHAGKDVDAAPMDIKRSLDECVSIIFDALDKQAKQITPAEVAQVASVSAENEWLGQMLQDIYVEIGKDGIVELDTSNLPNTYYDITEGVRLRNAGWLGPYSSTEPGKAVFKKPYVLISKQKISTTDDIEPVLKVMAANNKRELVLFVDDIDMSVATRLATTHLQGGFKSLIIKAPTLWRDWLFEDFARITGATVIDPANGITLAQFKLSYLGTCDKIITTKDETRVIGIQDVSEHITTLMAGTDEDKLRASWLQTKVATLRLGASSDSELSYLRLKAEDARNAAYLALQEGIVAGGGIALLNAADALPDTIGGTILKTALQAPTRQIMANAGKDLSLTQMGDTIGFNARTGEVIDMWEAGIVDPVMVTKNSVKNAISVAGTILTTQIVVNLPKKHEAPSQVPSMYQA